MPATSTVIIGGGILGLAVAEQLSAAGASVTLLEKESNWATHQTSHNSGVIHAGPYYRPGSLKARLCTAGNRSMVAFAVEHGIPHEVCGKLIVAVDSSEQDRLSVLYERALANGAQARMLSPGEVRDYEPNVEAVEALRVESTGIIDYGQVSRTLAELSTRNGAEMLLGARVESIVVNDSRVEVGFGGDRRVFDLLINCAGLHADRIAVLAGVAPSARIVPFRGEYYRLRPEVGQLVNGIIYPVPDPSLPFLGVHVTRGIDGVVHAGPNAVPALAREGYDWKTVNVRDSLEVMTYPGFLRMASRNVATGMREVARSFSRSLFAHDLARLVPGIGPHDIVRAGAGVRAQAVLRNGSLADDFVIQLAKRQIHVLNAPSPAATGALEIAKHIVASASEVSDM
ncbi:MAG TPA: L-2-hydroxyglutarate oxidase [Glaciibacter sp.]|nr:L-2-hydroxyglutarate oxidase [Glaciibacter sp.]